MKNGFDPALIAMDSYAHFTINDSTMHDLLSTLQHPQIVPKGNPTCNGGCTNTTDCSGTQNVGCTNTYICFAPGSSDPELNK